MSGRTYIIGYTNPLSQFDVRLGRATNVFAVKYNGLFVDAEWAFGAYGVYIQLFLGDFAARRALCAAQVCVYVSMCECAPVYVCQLQCPGYILNLREYSGLRRAELKQQIHKVQRVHQRMDSLCVWVARSACV